MSPSLLSRKAVSHPTILICCLFFGNFVCARAAEKSESGISVVRYGRGHAVAENRRFSFDAGDSYATPQGKRQLKRIAGLAAVAAEPGITLEGYSVYLETPAGLTIFVAQEGERQRQLREPAKAAEAIATLRGNRGIVSANPVFLDPDSGRWRMLAGAIILKLRPGIDADTYFGGYRGRVKRLAGTTDQFILKMTVASAEEIFAEVNRRWEDAAVEWAEPDTVGEMVKHVIPNDPFFPQQLGLNNTGQGGARVDADIDAAEAWNLTTGSPNVVIAIMDDSVDINHPDLSATIAQNPGEVPNGIDDDNNGYIDDVRGWDFFDNDNDPSTARADDGHGTACAGIAAAAGNNGQGIAGVAYNCRILPIRMFGVTDSALAQSIYYAAGRTSDGLRRWRGADVISMSLGLPQSAAADTAFNWAAVNGRGGKGCPIFIASGNSAARWQPVGLANVPPGTHTYDWQFVKDPSVSQGANTAWLDGVRFPDGSLESFEGTSLPPGWTTLGNANWSSVQNNVSGNHALTGWNGQSARAVRAGGIGHNQFSTLRVTRANNTVGEITFHIWVSAEEFFDRVNFYVDGVLYFELYDNPAAAVDITLDYPARLPNVIAVGASTDFDFRSDYSCYSGKLDFVAPSDGGTVAITTTDGIGGWGYEPGDYLNYFGGTSAACPVAAGVAGLVLSVNTNLTAGNVRRLMQGTCDKIGNVTYTSNTNLFYGRGRINAAAAVSNAAPRISSVMTNTTSVIIGFGSVLGWTYNLERAAAINGPWAAVQSNIAGTGNVVQVTDARVATPATRRYYRVRVLP